MSFEEHETFVVRDPGRRDTTKLVTIKMQAFSKTIGGESSWHEIEKHGDTARDTDRQTDRRTDGEVLGCRVVSCRLISGPVVCRFNVRTCHSGIPIETRFVRARHDRYTRLHHSFVAIPRRRPHQRPAKSLLLLLVAENSPRKSSATQNSPTVGPEPCVIGLMLVDLQLRRETVSLDR